MSGWLPLTGAVNARDVGGLPLTGGGTTRAGVLLRSDNLQQLTPEDVTELLERRDVRLVVDLRTRFEVRREGPGPLAGRVEIRHRSLHPEVGVATDAAASDVIPWGERSGDSPAVVAYMNYLRDRPDSIVAALDDIATADGGVLVHCAAGKDRTGMVCALALSAAGVERAAIVADFAATGERIGPLMARLRASETYRADLADSPDDAHLPHPATLERVFALLDEHYGGPVGWLERQGFEAAALRERLGG